MLIQPGNRKLGVQTLAFSLPAGKSCPGETKLCASCCYATKRFFKSGCVRKSLANNMRESAKPTFVKLVVDELRRRKSTSVRVHVSGDFYTAAYVRKWIAIARKCPHLTFYAYTRSWRVKRMLPALLAFADLPNVQLWWSVDQETDQLEGAPPAHAGIRVAHMQVTHDEPIPTYTDLVFRVKRDTIRKFIDGRLVCPAENGVEYSEPKMTCGKCGLCSTARAIPRKSAPCSTSLAEATQ